MSLSFKNIAPFLNANQNKISRWLSYVSLAIGVLLLLCSVQMYINIDSLLKNKNSKRDAYDYISVTKLITNENISQDHNFTDIEIKDLKQQPFVDDVEPLLANKFLVKAKGGSALPFSADMFLEAIDNNFIDTVPPGFFWKEGQILIPIIVSSDYLELYNTVFAPSRDLPQLSESTISAIVVQLEFAGVGGEEIFRGNIVAVSDRINSVLVPKNFLEWANKQYGNTAKTNSSRIFIKTKDANSTELLNYLQKKNYTVNKDKIKFGRVKQVLQAIISGLAGFGILVILLSMLLFSFYLQLMIARSKENLQLLLTIGYSPKWLSKIVSKRWMPVYLAIVTLGVVLTELLHWGFQHFIMNDRASLSPFIHWVVIVIAVTLLILSVIINQRLVKKILYKL